MMGKILPFPKKMKMYVQLPYDIDEALIKTYSLKLQRGWNEYLIKKRNEVKDEWLNV